MTNRLECGIINAIEDAGRFNLPTYISQPERLVSSINTEVNWLADIFGRVIVAREKISGVYEIRNKLNGHRYIGSAVNIYRRFTYHKTHLNRMEHHSQYLQRAWNSYGESMFEFNILLLCNPDMCVYYEQLCLDNLGSEYNMCPTASNLLGYSHTAETRSKMSKSHMGMTLSELSRNKLSLSQKGNQNWLGKKHTEETKRKMSVALLGNQRSLGFVPTSETRRKISDALKGRTYSEETIYKMSISHLGQRTSLGYRHTDESKRKMSMARKLWWAKRRKMENG